MRIVLASTSPRRIELLGQAGIRFETFSPEVDETPRPREAPTALVRRLAAAKAGAAERALPPAEDRVIIAADTIVVAPGGKRILNKPRDAEEARGMLKTLSGKTHQVLTAYCVLGRKRWVRVVASRVKIRKVTPEWIRAYVATGEPMDKAGAYAAQGIGAAMIEEIRGSYTNVVGLPMAQLLEDLEKRFGVFHAPA